MRRAGDHQRPDSIGLSCRQAAQAGWDFTGWVTAAAAGEVGDVARAHEALRNLRQIGSDSKPNFPKFRIFREAQRRERLLEGLRKAGLAE